MNLRRLPLPFSEFWKDSERLLLSEISAHDYDYILVRYLYNTGILFKLPEKFRERTIIDFDDIVSGSLYDSKYGSVQGLHKKFIAALNRRFLTKYEKKCLHFGASIFCSEKDMGRFLSSLNGSNAFVVPNIYAKESFTGYDFGDGFDKGDMLLFVGALGYGPNIRGLKWFMESVFPDFRKEHPGGKLLVVGRSPGEEVIQLCQRTEGIELYSDVPDIREYYQKCKAVVVPLLAGGGTRIKILEAALATRPVLSTGVGAEGLDLMGGRDLLLFETSEGFLKQYSKLRERSAYSSLVANAKRIVMANYSTQTFNERMQSALRMLDGNGGSRRN
jgi:glycosyltransferase involved in cell wall biosynthesis